MNKCYYNSKKKSFYHLFMREDMCMIRLYSSAEFSYCKYQLKIENKSCKIVVYKSKVDLKLCDIQLSIQAQMSDCKLLIIKRISF